MDGFTSSIAPCQLFASKSRLWRAYPPRSLASYGQPCDLGYRMQPAYSSAPNPLRRTFALDWYGFDVPSELTCPIPRAANHRGIAKLCSSSRNQSAAAGKTAKQAYKVHLWVSQVSSRPHILFEAQSVTYLYQTGTSIPIFSLSSLGIPS
jgi:hypothetical protein